VSASFAAFVAKNQLNKTSVKPCSRRDASIAAIHQNVALSPHSTAPNDIAQTPSNCRRVRTSGFGPVSQVFIFNGCNVHVAEGHERPVNGVELSRRTADCLEHPQPPLPVRHRENVQNPGQGLFQTQCGHRDFHIAAVESPTAHAHGGWCGGQRLEAVACPIRPWIMAWHCSESSQ
jgi:hypothetical protein